jgi:WD40 repeat protein
VSLYPNAFEIQAFCLGHENAITRILLHENVLISGGFDEYLFVWDYANGKILKKMMIPSIASDASTPTANETSASNETSTMAMEKEEPMQVEEGKEVEKKEDRCVSRILKRGDGIYVLMEDECQVYVYDLDYELKTVIKRHEKMMDISIQDNTMMMITQDSSVYSLEMDNQEFNKIEWVKIVEIKNEKTSEVEKLKELKKQFMIKRRKRDDSVQEE